MMRDMIEKMLMKQDGVMNVSVIQNALIKRNKIKRTRNENRSEFYMEVVNLKVKPKESFSGELTKGYKFNLKKSNQYNCEINNGVYYIIDKYGFKIPFSKEDFEETFVSIK